MVIQSKLNTDIFEITPINPELVSSIDQVYTLRQTAIQFFCNQREQTLTFTDEIERARCIVAFVDVLWRSEIPVKTLIITDISKTLEQIQRSFSLHTQLNLNSLSDLNDLKKDIHFLRYNNIIDKIAAKDTEAFFNQFDLIVADDIENEKQDLIRRRLKYHRAWLLNTNVPNVQGISF